MACNLLMLPCKGDITEHRNTLVELQVCFSLPGALFLLWPLF